MKKAAKNKKAKGSAVTKRTKLKSPSGALKGKVTLPENLDTMDLSKLWEVTRQ